MKRLYALPLSLSVVLMSALPALAQGGANNGAMPESAGIIAWVVVGLIGGFLASRVVNKSGEGTLRDILLGIVGGVIGGVIFRAFGSHGVTGVNLWSILVAFVGGIVVLFIYHAVRGQSATGHRSL
jgi:uncharacterized membrane protein YeaQ/YmgE (transglycosylase-associated protein family)